MNFRPPNSSESNLFIIRASIQTTIGGDSNAVQTISSPSSNNLPKSFQVTRVGTDEDKFLITYGTGITFINLPNIQINMSNTIDKGMHLANLYNLTRTSSNLRITKASDGTSSPTQNLNFEIFITGHVSIGHNTGNNNRGWAIENSSNPTRSSTNMHVGIGTGALFHNSSALSSLTLNGALYGTPDTVNTSNTGISLNTIVTLINSSSGVINMTIGSGINGQIKYLVCISGGNNATLPGASLDTGNDVIFNQDGDGIMLIYNGSTSKWSPFGGIGF